MNYTLKQLQERVNKLIEQQGEDAYCGAWIYTAEDCVMYDNDDDENYVYIRGRRTRFDEAHFLIKEDNMTMLLTVYGDFTLNKKLHED